jgi:DNA-binding MurR/RpiR family transcriptional regulator
MAELLPSDLRPFEEEVASRVADVRGGLSRNDERILGYLQQQVDELPFHTSDSLAQAAGVSRAAVVRFAIKLGYSGFTEMQKASRQALREEQAQESPLSRFSGAPTGSLLERKAVQDSRNVLATEALIRDTIEPAAQSIAQAERVFLVAGRTSVGLGVYFHRLLAGVRASVRLVDAAFPDELTDAGPRDVVVGFLFRRYARGTVELLKVARTAGSHVVLVTDGRGHDFAAHADQVIVAVATSPALYDSMVGPVFALELLVAEVAAADPKRSRQRLEAVESFNQGQRTLLG